MNPWVQLSLQGRVGHPISGSDITENDGHGETAYSGSAKFQKILGDNTKPKSHLLSLSYWAEPLRTAILHLITRWHPHTHFTWMKSTFSSVQSPSRVRLFATPWTAARQASLSITNSWSLLKLMSITLVMPPNHLILCHPLLLPPSVFPSIRVFSNVPPYTNGKVPPSILPKYFFILSIPIANAFIWSSCYFHPN